MTAEQQNNPLYGLKLDDLLTELVAFYGWDVLAAELRFDCFAGDPSIAESLKFLNNTTWAREKLEAFYLYRFKGLPRPHDEQYKLPPRERSFAAGIVPRNPMNLTAKEDKSPASPGSKLNFKPYRKSSCDKGYCLPKSNPKK
ncbi:MAG TPA: VF530 family DNA-binding protein [Psychromonas sp.]